jgi:hypothetical protein
VKTFELSGDIRFGWNVVNIDNSQSRHEALNLDFLATGWWMTVETSMIYDFDL